MYVFVCMYASSLAAPDFLRAYTSQPFQVPAIGREIFLSAAIPKKFLTNTYNIFKLVFHKDLFQFSQSTGYT